MRRSIFLAIGLLLLTQESRAQQNADPKMDDVCAPSPVIQGAISFVNPRRLVGHLFKTHAIHDFDLDTQGGDVGFDQKINAILNGSVFCEKPRQCSKDAVAQLGKARTNLTQFISRNSRPLPVGEDGFEAVSQRPLDVPLLAAFLKGNTQALRVSCIKSSPMIAAPKSDETQKKIADVVTNVRVRKKVDDLAYDRDAAKFKDLERASISFSDDYLKASRVWTAEGVVGVPVADGLLGDYSSLIAFASYKGQYVGGANPKKLPDIGNIGAGLLGSFVFPVLTHYQDMQLYTHYVHSQVTDSDLLSGTFVWTLNIPVDGIRAQAKVPGLPIWYGIKPQLKAVYGHVMNAGTNPDLLLSNEYARAGGRIELSLFGEGEILKYFTLVTAYEYWKVFSGPFNSLWRFESTLNFKFPDQEYWSFQIRYVNGYDFDTLDRQHQLTAGLGLKY